MKNSFNNFTSSKEENDDSNLVVATHLKNNQYTKEYMNPLRIFDYLFYRIALFYDRILNYQGTHEFAGIGILSLFQLANLITIFEILGVSFTNPNQKVPVLFVVFYLVSVLFNTIRYKKVVTYTELCEKWNSDNGNKKIFKKITVMVYGCISILLLGLN